MSESFDPKLTELLSFGLARVRPDASLRERVLAQTGGGGSRVCRTNELEWASSPFAGVSFKVLHQNADNGLLTMLLRMEPGASYPAHRHAQDEQCFVLGGDLRADDQVYGSGDFVFEPKGSVHARTWTRDGSLLLLISAPDNALLPA